MLGVWPLLVGVLAVSTFVFAPSWSGVASLG